MGDIVFLRDRYDVLLPQRTLVAQSFNQMWKIDHPAVCQEVFVAEHRSAADRDQLLDRLLTRLETLP